VTLAKTPTGLYISDKTDGSVEIKWNKNGNPGWTRYGIAMSEDNFGVNIDTVVSYGDNHTALTKNVAGLAGITTYWFRVWAYNEEGVETAFDGTVSTVTASESVAPAQITTLSAIVSVFARTIDLSLPPYGDTGYSEAWSVTGLEDATVYYFAIKACDEIPNFSVCSNEASARTKLSDIIKPEIIYFRPPDGAIGVAISTKILLGFSELMNEEETEKAVEVRAIKDNLGRNTNTVVTIKDNLGRNTNTVVNVSFTWTGSTLCLSVSLKNNHTYKIVVSSAQAKDLANNCLEEGAEKTFTTIMAYDSENVVAAVDSGGKKLYEIEIEPNALPVDSYIRISTSPLTSSDKAHPAAIRRAEAKSPKFGDAYHFSIPGTMREFNAYDADDNYRDENFSADVKITIPYKDKGNGIVDGTFPPIRERTLAIYWLDERHNLWVKIPSSEVDVETDTVSACIPHFSVYTVMGQNSWDLSNAKAFPVPYIAGKDVKGHDTDPPDTIIFTELSSLCTIKIYTITGELVRCLEHSDATSPAIGQEYWDVKNDDGDAVASEVYIYYICNARQNKTGKLIIIR